MPRYSLRTLMVFVGIVVIATPVVVHFWPRDIMTAPPQFVLDRLDARFEQLNSTMDFDDAFAALGLERYQLFLTSRALGSGGMSGERTYLDLGTDGYTLEMVTYWDGRRAFILRTPTTATPREAELACVEARLAS